MKDVCDFCSSTMPMWTVLCSERILAFPVLYSKDWAACNKCVEYIKAKDVNGLIDHIILKDNIPISSGFREKLQWLYGRIFSMIESIKEDSLSTSLSSQGETRTLAPFGNGF